MPLGLGVCQIEQILMMSIPTILDILLDFSLVVILLFLSIKTKSKGITLIFITKAIDKIVNYVVGSYIIDYLDKSLPIPETLDIIRDIQAITIGAGYVLGVYIVYREYKANKFSTAQSDVHD